MFYVVCSSHTYFNHSINPDFINSLERQVEVAVVRADLTHLYDNITALTFKTWFGPLMKVLEDSVLITS